MTGTINPRSRLVEAFQAGYMEDLVDQDELGAAHNIERPEDGIRLSQTSDNCQCDNPLCTHTITDDERANLFESFDEGLPDGVRYMPLREDKRGPVIRGRCRLDSEEARSLLVTAEEAARRIREEGARGFFIYAGRKDQDTEWLVILDRDEPDRWPETPETLRVISGSGESDHLYYRNDGSVERAKAKGELKGAGSVQAKNWGVVTPGSIHHKTDGIYYIAANPGITTLSNDDLTDPFLPSAATPSTGKHTYQGLDDPDKDAIETVMKAIVNFRRHSESSWRAIEYFEDLRAGNDLREHGFIPEDSENKKGCRHEANLTLATLLQGMLLMAGEADKERNRWLIHQYLAYVANQYPRTSCGQRRKLLLSDTYLVDRAAVAIENFDHGAFIKWMRKTKDNNFTGEYSPALEERVISVTKALAQEDGSYPSKADIVEVCHKIDGSRTEGTYGECLSRLAGKRLKQAKCGWNDYRYYPFGMDDPEDAIEVKPKGWV